MYPSFYYCNRLRNALETCVQLKQSFFSIFDECKDKKPVGEWIQFLHRFQDLLCLPSLLEKKLECAAYCQSWSTFETHDMDVELEKTLDEISLFLFYANQNKCSLSNQQVWKDKEDQEDHSFCRFCAKGIPEDSYCFQAHLNKSCFQTLVLCWVDRYDYFHELVSQQDFLDGMMKQIMQISISSCVLFSNIGGQQQWNCSLLSADAFLEAPHWLDVFKQFVQLSFE